ncbi:MAG: transposase domain-containing protein [Pseudomonadota bacterium]
MLGHNPGAYLADTLARIKSRADADPIDDLLPYNWVNTNAAQASFETSDIARAA